MKVAFIDESGSPSPNDNKQFFVVAALITNSSRAIELHVKRTRRTLRVRSPRNELKATHSRPVVIKRLLKAIGQEECDIYAVVVDKHGIKPELAETVYRVAVGRTVLRCVQDHPELHLYLDKRYTNHRQRLELERVMRKAIASIPEHIVIIEQVDSTAYPGLQAVDFVAWALAQKHEQNEVWAREIIAHCIVAEEIIEAKKLAALPGSR